MPDEPPGRARARSPSGSGWTTGPGFDLTEAGTKKRLAVYLVADPAEIPGVARLGPDPLAADFTVQVLAGLLAGRRTQIKGLLRDQSVIAGIGNAYSDEVLHAARMSPFRLAASLTAEEVAALHDVIVTTLREAVGQVGRPGRRRSEGGEEGGAQGARPGRQPCPVCGDTVREVSFADSALQYCPTCQTGGKPLADRRLSGCSSDGGRWRAERDARPAARSGPGGRR